MRMHACMIIIILIMHDVIPQLPPAERALVKPLPDPVQEFGSELLAVFNPVDCNVRNSFDLQ